MLQLLRLLLLTLTPLFQQQTNVDALLETFPSTYVFDAIAPYDPVRFTPPPNDPYGITKNTIHDALMGVLRYHTIHTATSTPNEDKDSMIVLSIRLFLERLSPPSMDPFADDDADDADSKTVHDRIDALQNITEPLALSHDSQALPLSEITHAVLSELSDVFISCHDDASAAVMPGKVKTDERCKEVSKQLALPLL